jgi:hypothetical protein
MKKKFNFILVHGWAFDSSFWSGLKILLEKKTFCSEVTCIDLGFFLSESKKKKNLKILKNQIFVVHSLGLQWFLNKKINCELLINFFGSPNFIKFQNNQKMKKRILNKMISKFRVNPDLVLKDFYSKCGQKYSNKKINKNILLNYLIDLRDKDQEKEFMMQNFKKVSFFNKKDKIFSSSKYMLENLRDKNHQIFFLDENEHSLPFSNPSKTLELIEKSLKL